MRKRKIFKDKFNLHTNRVVLPVVETIVQSDEDGKYVSYIEFISENKGRIFAMAPVNFNTMQKKVEFKDFTLKEVLDIPWQYAWYYSGEEDPLKNFEVKKAGGLLWKLKKMMLRS